MFCTLNLFAITTFETLATQKSNCVIREASESSLVLVELIPFNTAIILILL